MFFLEIGKLSEVSEVPVPAEETASLLAEASVSQWLCDAILERGRPSLC